MKAYVLGFVTSLLPSFAQAGLSESVDSFFGQLNGVVGSVIFYDVLFFMDGVSLPLAVLWLVVGALFFTFKMNFINVRGFWHATQVVRGNYISKEKKEDDLGEVNHFQALTAALSATVGLGNIAGVAVAISLGGPGATFWMIIAGLIGMASKFTECTLAQIYKVQRPDGRVMGGPMEYLSTGLAEMGHAKLGKVLSVVFAVLCIGGSFGGGGSFQVNQSLSAVKLSIPVLGEQPWLYGLLFSFFVGIVILGGIKRIASTAEKIVPIMCGFYLLVSFYILLADFTAIPAAFASIISGAFTPEAGYGGFIGVLVVGFQRAAFSNEAGVGSSPIAHAAAKSDHPVREGVVALLEPFIDTVVVCTVTALVIIITGAYNDPQYETVRAAKEGAALTSLAFGSVVSWFPLVLSVAVCLFAYSTIISWSYYGERCWVFLFGDKYSFLYKILLLAVIFCGAITSATNILEFGDLMILSMAFPNILGLYFLSGKVKDALNDYSAKYM